MRSSYALRPRVDNLYLVRERDRRRRRELLAILALAAPAGLCLLIYSWSHLQVLEAGYRIEELGRELHELHQEERQLTLEVARLANPRRIDTLARQELGMVSPEPHQVERLEARR